ncbi:sensor domain-containing protein [Desulfotruncus alcoholivorax]|uniref:sensor domain-containing protein n=1 Tax=Desulfotruncus alcoholivorax TaxID=265477 RepID=UPI00041EB712|nr:EAL domain-containing protein [Desulfotruncus alcoholivorax]
MNNKQTFITTIKIIALYILFGGFWIYASDLTLNNLFYEPRLTFFQTIKGLLFVLVTSIVFFFIIHKELSKQAAISSKLANESKRLFSLINALPALLCLMADDYSIQYANKYFKQRFGDVEGSKCYQILKQRNKPCSGCDISELLDKQEHVEREFKAWDNCIYRIYDYPFHDVDNTPLVLKLGLDITGHRLAEEAKRAEETRYYTLFNSMMEGFALHEIICDHAGKPYDYRFLDVNKAFENITGLKHADVVGKTVLEVLPQTESYWIETYGEVALNGQPRKLNNYSKALDKYLDVYVFCPKPKQFATIFFDTTDIQLSQKALQESEVRLARIVETVPNGIIIFDTLGRIIFANEAAQKILQVEESLIEHKIYNDPLWKISSVKGGPFPEAELPFACVMRTRKPVWHVEHAIEHNNGAIVMLSVNAAPLFDATGNLSGVVASFHDITEQKQMEQHLYYMATYDYLTKVPNRYYLEQALDKVIANAKSGPKSALLLIDIDNFKIINDLFGHNSGDRVLINIAELIGSNLRSNDLLARIGGDEFAALLEDADEASAAAMAEKIRSSVDEYEFILNNFGNFSNISISIGITIIDGTMDSAQLLSNADIALHAAKELGRNRAVFNNPDSNPSAKLERFNNIVQLIKRALKEEQFIVHYQPIYDIREGKTVISHYEALVRLIGMDNELILPGEFIPIAEDFSLMPQIDRWVVSTVLQTLQSYRDINIFVNISGLSLGEEDLLSFIERAIIESGINPSRLGFEITETSAVRDLLLAERWVHKLKSIGCKFLLDDFGIGFSTFAYLNSIPVDYLKIDGSFIKNIHTDLQQRAIVQAMCSIAHILGKQTIAEFVENVDVLKVLRELQIDFGQGYHFGKPRPIEDWYIA